MTSIARIASARNRDSKSFLGRGLGFSRNAFTTLELLVVVSVIGLLCALILPAVQSARETARKTACATNLKMLAAATQSYEGTMGRYPRAFGAVGEDGVQPSYMHCSAFVLLFPHLEQTALYQRIDPKEGGLAAEEPLTLWKDPGLLDVSVPGLVCPSDDVPTGGNSYRICYGTSPGIHATWVPGRGWPGPTERDALVGLLRAARNSSRVTDGLSSTVMFSERVVGDFDSGSYDRTRDVLHIEYETNRYVDEAYQRCVAAQPSEDHFSSSGRTWLIADYFETGYNHILPPNSTISDCFRYSVVGYDGAMTARSWHRDGVNVAMGDGAVRFVADGIDLKVWRAIATIHGGEVVSF